MEKIILTPEVLEFLEDLVFELFLEEYFAYPENAKNYVDKIIDFIHTELLLFPSKITPKQLQYPGSNYVFIKLNNRTTWYIFFEKENCILITGITNNHSQEAKYLH